MIAVGLALALLPPIGGRAAGGLPVGRPAAGRRHHASCRPPSARSTTGWRRCVAQRLLPLLAVERARRVRESAAVAVSGVVAALSLAVALTVMVASFRDSVARWLDVRAAGRPVPAHGDVAARPCDTALLAPAFVQDVRAGARRARASRRSARARCCSTPARPPVALLARAIDDPARDAAAGGRARARAAGPGAGLRERGDGRPLRRAAAAQPLAACCSRRWPAAPLLRRRRLARLRAADRRRRAWTLRDYQRLTGDPRVNDVQLWLAPGADAAQVQAARARAGAARQPATPTWWSSPRPPRCAPCRCASSTAASPSPTGCRRWPSRIGLFGVAASFSAQVLARRKEFGLLAHLGLTRRADPGAWSPAKARPGR